MENIIISYDLVCEAGGCTVYKIETVLKKNETVSKKTDTENKSYRNSILNTSFGNNQDTETDINSREEARNELKITEKKNTRNRRKMRSGVNFSDK